jgi:hypothetical protein
MVREAMQRVKIGRRTRILHIETELGVINVHLGLSDHRGRRVEAVMMNPNQYAGELVVKRVGLRFVEMKRLKRIGVNS